MGSKGKGCGVGARDHQGEGGRSLGGGVVVSSSYPFSSIDFMGFVSSS